MELSSRYAEAVEYAVQLHRGQRRKLTGVVYVSHLLSVSALVLQQGGDEHEAIAALLHDAVEDQGGLPILADIQRRFGPEVAAVVEGCSDAVEQPKPPWRQRKEEHLRRLAGAPRPVLLVKACDVLDNARSVLASYRQSGPQIWSQFRGGRDGTLWHYRSLLELLSQANLGDVVDQLQRTVKELEQLVAAEG